MSDKITGIILSIYDFKENDLLLKVITSENKIFSLIAKGAKKITTKKHYLPHLEMQFDINYKETSDIFTIINSRLINNFYVSDLESLAFLNLFTNLVSKEMIADSNIYQKYQYFLACVNTENRYIIGSILIAYILKINGVLPHVDSCLFCNSKYIASFSIKYGGFLCKNHLNNQSRLSKELLNDLYNYLKTDIEAHKGLNTNNAEAFEMLYQFSLNHLNIKKDSFSFFQSLKQK